MTKYEKAIYDLITHTAQHLTAEQVHSALKAGYPSVSLATVYNNLNKLCQTGLIRRISTEGSPDRYDRAAKHDHLVCARCGALTDARFPDLTDALGDQLGKDLLFYDLKVYYVCPACRERENGSPAG